MGPGASTSRASAAGAVALLLVTSAARTAGAQTVAGVQADEDRRTAMYRQGVEAAAAGRWAEARERFQAALALRPSPRVFFSLAQCEEQLGQVASAQADYARAQQWAHEAAADSDVAAAADQAARALEPRVPHLRVVVSGANSPAATLDEKPIVPGEPIPVDPGLHQVVVRATGMRDASVSAAVGEGQQLDLPVRLEVEAPSPPPGRALDAAPVAAAPSAGPGPWRAIALIAGGAGVAALGVGAYFGVDARSKNDESYAQGCNGDECPAKAAATRRDALSAANASTVCVVAGGVLVAAGVALWIVAPSHARPNRVGVVPVALGPGGGVAIEGAWR
jgi:hypothetical protein